MIRLWLLLSLLLLSCAPARPAPPPAQPEATGPRVILPDGFVVDVEIAANDELRAQGLMFRDRLAPDAGMLFIFAEPGEHSFWMRNTRIPLDMIWLDGERRIIHVEPDVPPCVADPCPSYGPEKSSSYVLELAAGEAAKHVLREGDVLRFEKMDNIVVE